MNPDLKVLVEEFEKAINESVCESDRVAAVVTDMKRAGYDVTLVLEATIGVSLSPEGAHAGKAESVPAVLPAIRSNGEVELTEQDEKFLKALKISAGD